MEREFADVESKYIREICKSNFNEVAKKIDISDDSIVLKMYD